MRKRLWKSWTAAGLAAVMVTASLGWEPYVKQAQAQDAFSDNAELMQGASIVQDEERNSKVLSLPGGAFDAGWLKLPDNLYDEVTDGFTVALKVKPAADSGDYERIFQSTSIDFGEGDTWWWDAPDFAFNVGAVNDGGWNSMHYLGTVKNTADNAVSGGATRMKMMWNEVMTKGEWHDVVVSVSRTDYAVYLDGTKLELTSTQGDGDLEKVLENTFSGDFLSSYVNNAIGHSVYASDNDFKGMVDDVTFYSRALTEEEAKNLPDDASYRYTFEDDTVDGTIIANTAKEESVVPEADYFWDFENVVNQKAANGGAAGEGDAVLMGTAKVEAADISVGGKTYSSEGNQVLILAGGAKGTSYVDLPTELYQGVDAETGFTYSFWAKADSSVGSYTRAISSAAASNGDEFAYAPYAADKVWNVIFDSTNLYRAIYASEPAKDIWSLITFTVDRTGIVFYVNGEEVGSSVTAGGESELKNRLNGMDKLVLNSLGKTNSGWNDADCAISLDDVSLYKRALTAKEVAEIANAYGFSVEAAEQKEYGSAAQLTDGTAVTAVEGVSVVSPDGTLKTQLMTDSKTGRFFYTTEKNGITAIQASQLGIYASVDFTQDMVYVEGSLTAESGTENYTLTSGANSEIADPYQAISFELAKKDDAAKKVEITIKSFNGGIAYQYTLHGVSGTKESITGEASEYVLPATADVWAGNTDVNYEFEFTKRSMKAIKSLSGNLSVPLLANDGDIWVLISEGAVYNDEDPYCASYLSTQAGTRNLKVQFGNKQTSAVTKTYKADGTVSTPWRVAAIADNLNDIVNASIFTSVNPEPDAELYADTSYIRQGRVAWSWWSESGDDPVEYEQQKDYIDFAAENGWEYVCIDFGWCLWDDYQTKVKELVDYAESKGVSIMLWYGVNNANHSGFKDAAGDAAYPKYSLKTTAQLEEQFAWCQSVGVKGVKVDYYESDNQDTMRQMYECATIAAKNKLNVLFHGCNVPSGEQRTFPNVLGYEAVRGAEWYKWNVGPSVANNLTYLFTRNVLGGMDYTPPAMKIDQLSTTAGFQLAQVVAFESGLQNYASSVFKLEGFKGLALMNDIAVKWDETQLIDGYPGEYLAVARRSGEDWYIGAMTAEDWSTTLELRFLGDGEYNAYIFKDNEDGSDIAIETAKVTKESGLPIELLANGGVSVKLTKGEMNLKTKYDDYTFYEAEDSANILGGNTSVIKNQFVSGMKRVTGIGGLKSNTLTMTQITVPEDGVYEMRLYYSTGVERRMCYSINGEEAIRTKKLNCGVNAVSAESFYVTLKKGTNTIVFFNNEAKAPDVDRIAISNTKTDMAPTETDNTDDGNEPVDGTQYEYTIYDAEDAELAGGAILENGGIGWLGGSASCTAAFTVTVDESGNYKLQITYYAGETRDLQIRVNDGEVITVTCPSTGSYTADSAESIYIDVPLKAGENKITLFNASGWAPNILCIGVSTITAEADAPEKPTEDVTETLGDDTAEETETKDDAGNKKNDGSPDTGDWFRGESVLVLLIVSAGVILLLTKRKKVNDSL